MLTVTDKHVVTRSRGGAVYRAYGVDESGRSVGLATLFEAADDVTALTRARALLGNSGIQFELWEGMRRVGPTLVPCDGPTMLASESQDEQRH
jgi:hypothetical protein